MKLEAGSCVGPYEVVAAIAVGGMGEVYRARDPRLARDVALKLLPSGLASADALRRFEQEARAASALNHPNIVTIYEIGRFDDMPYISMELIEGVSLRQELRNGRVVLKEAMRIASKVADGLSAAHEKGIVHRDLKPENVMISADGFVKILDFGLAKLEKPSRDNDATDLQTAPGVVYGTAGYMSPEQARAGPIDFRSDQFSFGAIVYEMVTGLRAFRRETNLDTLAAIVRDDPDPISQVNPEVPAEIQIIVERCLAKEPRERYGSTRDLARDLRDVRNRLSQQTTLPLLGKPRRWLPSRRAVGATALSVAIIAVIAVGARKTHVDPRPRTSGIPQEKHLAVLPFTELSGRADAQMFSEGISQTVSARLSRSRDVQVVSAGPAGSAASGDDLQRIGRDLGANLVLRGTVQRASDQIRISYTLLRTDGGLQLAGDTVTGPADDVFAIEDRLAESVVNALEVRSAAPSGTLGRTGLESPSDQEGYLQAVGMVERFRDARGVDTAIARLESLSPAARNSALVNAALGRDYLYKYYLTHDTTLIPKAAFYCDRAIKADANAAEAHSTLGELHKTQGTYPQAINEFRTALSEQPNSFDAMIGLADAYDLSGRLVDAERTYQRAIDLNPHYARAYTRFGKFYFDRGQYAKAAAMFRKMTEIAPDMPRGFSNLGGALQAQGRYDEALQAYNRSLALLPTSTAWSNIGTCDFFLGHYGAAAAAYEKATQLTPKNYELWAFLGDAYRWMAPGAQAKSVLAYQQAIALGRQELALNPKNKAVCATIASCYAKSGKLPEARTFLARAIALDPADPATMYQAAVIASASGNYSEAAEWLRRSIARGYAAADAQRDPEFAALRKSAEFGAILREGRPQAERTAR